MSLQKKHVSSDVEFLFEVIQPLFIQPLNSDSNKMIFVLTFSRYYVVQESKAKSRRVTIIILVKRCNRGVLVCALAFRMEGWGFESSEGLSTSHYSRQKLCIKQPPLTNRSLNSKVM